MTTPTIPLNNVTIRVTVEISQRDGSWNTNTLSRAVQETAGEFEDVETVLNIAKEAATCAVDENATRLECWHEIQISRDQAQTEETPA